MRSPDAGWLRLSPWAALPAVLGIVRGNPLQALPALAGVSALVATTDWIGLREMGFGAVALAVALVAYGIAWQRRFRYRIDDDGIAVRSGVAHRSEVELSWERVRNVDLRQPFYFRPLDRVALIVEGSGGQDEEVAIQAVRRDVAERVRESIVSHQHVQTGEATAAGTAPVPVAETEAGEPAATAATGADRAVSHSAVLHQPSTRDILIHGAINGRAFGLLLAGVGAVYTAFQPVITESEVVSAAMGQMLRWGWQALLLVLPGLVALSVALVGVSALIALVRFYGFRLVRDRDRFRVRHGLFETRERTLRTSKLQAVTVVETAVGRLLGRCHLLAHQASSAAQHSSADADGTAEIPALATDAAQSVIGLFDAGYGDRPPLGAIDPAFCRFWAIRLGLPVALASAAGLIAVLVFGPLWGLATVAVSLVAVALPLGAVALVHVRWRHWGWAVHDDVVHIASGFAGRQRVVFRVDRVQQVAVLRTPFQRRAGLATVALSLADSDRRIPFLPHDVAVALANRVLYTVETRPHLDF